MELTTLAWLCMAAYAVHMVEEHMLDWRNWARATLGLPVEWSDFYVTNGIVVALGIAQAMLTSALPLAPLSFAGLMLINALFFHVFPFVLSRGRFSQGLFTAVILFFPLGIATFWVALSSGRADAGTAIAGLVIGSLTMAFPVVLLRIRSKPYFRQDPAHP